MHAVALLLTGALLGFDLAFLVMLFMHDPEPTDIETWKKTLDDYEAGRAQDAQPARLTAEAPATALASPRPDHTAYQQPMNVFQLTTPAGWRETSMQHCLFSRN